ncbi:hypothetical protein HDV05_004145 [Chytridiales sp. JEL 0842]|nr:hypothetical protein HDV05_004145 [Chytridiales sp. JEL 0842]
MSATWSLVEMQLMMSDGLSILDDSDKSRSLRISQHLYLSASKSEYGSDDGGSDSDEDNFVSASSSHSGTLARSHYLERPELGKRPKVRGTESTVGAMEVAAAATGVADREQQQQQMRMAMMVSSSSVSADHEASPAEEHPQQSSAAQMAVPRPAVLVGKDPGNRPDELRSPPFPPAPSAESNTNGNNNNNTLAAALSGSTRENVSSSQPPSVKATATMYILATNVPASMIASALKGSRNDINSQHPSINSNDDRRGSHQEDDEEKHFAGISGGPMFVSPASTHTGDMNSPAPSDSPSLRREESYFESTRTSLVSMNGAQQPVGISVNLPKDSGHGAGDCSSSSSPPDNESADEEYKTPTANIKVVFIPPSSGSLVAPSDPSIAFAPKDLVNEEHSKPTNATVNHTNPPKAQSVASLLDKVADSRTAGSTPTSSNSKITQLSQSMDVVYPPLTTSQNLKVEKTFGVPTPSSPSSSASCGAVNGAASTSTSVTGSKGNFSTVKLAGGEDDIGSAHRANKSSSSDPIDVTFKRVADTGSNESLPLRLSNGPRKPKSKPGSRPLSAGTKMLIPGVDTLLPPHQNVDGSNMNRSKSPRGSFTSSGLGLAAESKDKLDASAHHKPPSRADSERSLTQSPTKDQKKFERVFPDIAGESETLTGVYNCAYEKDVLWQGKMYITANYVSFYGMIFGKATILNLPLREVVCIEKKNTAGVFPNAVRVSTLDTKYVFASFLKRDSAYGDLMEVWKACNLYLTPEERAHIKRRFSTELCRIAHEPNITSSTNTSDSLTTSENSTPSPTGTPASTASTRQRSFSTAPPPKPSLLGPHVKPALRTIESDTSLAADDFPASTPSFAEHHQQCAVPSPATGVCMKSGRSATFSKFEYVRRLFSQESSGAVEDASAHSVNTSSGVVVSTSPSTSSLSSKSSAVSPVQAASGQVSTPRGLNAASSGAGASPPSPPLSGREGPGPERSGTGSSGGGGGHSKAPGSGGSGGNADGGSGAPPTPPAEPVAPPAPARPSEAVSCGCTSHPEHLVVNQVVPLDIQDLIQAVFQENGSVCVKRAHTVRETENLHVGPWSVNGEGVWDSRDLTYNPSFKMPMMSKTTTPASEHQKVVAGSQNPDSLFLVVDAAAKTPKVPYGEMFTVINRYCLTHEGPGKARLRISTKVDFVKKLMLKGQIEGGSIDGSKGFGTELVKQLKGYKSQSSGSSFGAPGSVVAAVEAETGTESDALRFEPKTSTSRHVPNGGLRPRKSHRRLGSRHVSEDGMMESAHDSAVQGDGLDGLDQDGLPAMAPQKDKTMLEFVISVAATNLIARPLFVIVWLCNFILSAMGLPKLQLQDDVAGQTGRYPGVSSSKRGGQGGKKYHRSSSVSLRRRSGDYSHLIAQAAAAGSSVGESSSASVLGNNSMGSLFVVCMMISLILGVCVTALNVFWMSRIGARLDKALTVVKLLKVEKVNNVGGASWPAGSAGTVPKAGGPSDSTESATVKDSPHVVYTPQQVKSHFEQLSFNAVSSMENHMRETQRTSFNLQSKLDKLKQEIESASKDVEEWMKEDEKAFRDIPNAVGGAGFTREQQKKLVEIVLAAIRSEMKDVDFNSAAGAVEESTEGKLDTVKEEETPETRNSKIVKRVIEHVEQATTSESVKI